MTLTAVNQVVRGVYAVGKIGVAFLDLIAVEEDKEMPRLQKVLRVAADILAIGGQTTFLAANVSDVSSSTKLACNIAAGVTDFTQKIVVLSGRSEAIGWGDYLDLGGGVFLRVLSIVKDAIIFQPEFFGKTKECVELVANLVEMSGNVTTSRNSLVANWQRVRRLLASMRKAPPEEQPLVIAPDHGKKPPVIKLAPADAEQIYCMKRMRTIEELEEIPELFHEDRVLRCFRCSLSGRSIRHLLVVAATKDFRNPVYYERKQILQKLADGSAPPQGWPAEVPWEEKSLREAPAMQQMIDSTLEELLELVHAADFLFDPLDSQEDELLKQGEKMLKIVAILKALHLERIGEMRDEEISEVIVARTSSSTIESVYVTTTMHKFSASAEPKPTKVIRFQPTVTLLGRSPLSEDQLFAATRAALLSQDPREKKALLLAQLPFHILISTDLQDLEIVSEFVRSPYKRKEEILKMMKEALQLEQLTLSDEDLAAKISVVVSRKKVDSVYVNSITHRFSPSSEPQSSKVIALVLPGSQSWRVSSIDKLYAAARSIFGSQSTIDLGALCGIHHLAIYVETNFRNVDIQEVS